MAVAHEEKKKSGDALDDLPILSADNLQNNMKIIYYSRTFLSIIGGVIAGILGLTGLNGFICYFLIMAIASLGLLAKANFSVNTYFSGWSQILLDGFLSGLMSFVLFWTNGFTRMWQDDDEEVKGMDLQECGKMMMKRLLSNDID